MMAGRTTMRNGVGVQAVDRALAILRLFSARRAELELVEIPPGTITSAEQLAAELAEIRRRGYAVDREELYLGLVCVAVPVFDRFGAPMAALGVSGPSARVAPGRFPGLVESLERH